MKLMAPDYYPHFACIADRCRHSCCVGWEIDVDEDALVRYQDVPGALGRRLKDAIVVEDDAAHFRLDEQERCPFLNEKGLCDLIIGLGEDSLCQICADHPRYRSFFSNRTEIGLGLSCEAAARLVLTWPKKVDFITLEDDGIDDEPPMEDEALLRWRDMLLSIVQDRVLPIERRVEAVLAQSQMALPEMSEALPFLLGLERLDPQWGKLLEEAQEAHPCPLDEETWALPMEQLLVALLCRHLPGALEDGDLMGRTALCVLCWRVIRHLLGVQAARQGNADIEDLIEITRMFSSEIEYSDENIDAILDWLAEGDFSVK